MAQTAFASRLFARLLVCAAVSGFAVTSGCDRARDKESPIAPTGSVSGQDSPQPLGLTRYALSGLATDNTGSPIPNMSVEVDFAPGSPTSSPAASCPSGGRFCWRTTKTDSRGVYHAEFDSQAFSWAAGGVAYVYAWSDRYETNVQIVKAGSSSVIQDLRMRDVRHVAAGASLAMTIAPDSSACSDLEDWWLLGSRCEILRIDADAPGMLRVEAQPVGGGAEPFLFFATSGNYGGSQVPGSKVATVPVKGGSYTVFVALPSGVDRQDVMVVTSLE